VHYALCASVEYPASALLSEEQEHGVKERGGGGKEDEGGEEGRQYLSRSDYYNITLASYQVKI
jgi:hypothetical protein